MFTMQSHYIYVNYAKSLYVYYTKAQSIESAFESKITIERAFEKGMPRLFELLLSGSSLRFFSKVTI